MNEKLREQVKYLKLFQGITYKEIAELLEISLSGIYNWLKEEYDLSYSKQIRLQEIINYLKE